jgi:predicted cobalt transporter CbtA
MKTQQSITSLPASPADDRRKRMIQYTVAMSIRMVCVLLLFVVQGWWLLVVGLGAVILPYIAVVLANNVHTGAPGTVERPGAVVPVRDPRAPSPYSPEHDA